MKYTTATPINTDKESLKREYPLHLSVVPAGFPSPAEDYIEKSINLHNYIIKNPPATYFVKVEGDSMTEAGIFSGDILVVDRSLEPTHNKIVIAVLDGELTVKRLIKTKSGVSLKAENKDHPDITVPDEGDLTIWGIVTTVIHKV
jgi:DNA polymerase V